MIIDELTVGMVQTRCYILGAEGGQACIVIDPGDEAARIRKADTRAGYLFGSYQSDPEGGTVFRSDAGDPELR